MNMDDFNVKPANLLISYARLFTKGMTEGLVLDLACGDGHNGIFLAKKGLDVICCDSSEEALKNAKQLAAMQGVSIETWCVDLEKKGTNPFIEDFYGGIIIFRYLHRPLISCIRKALKKGGVLIYETFTVQQAQFGKPHNPDFLLKPEELRNWFMDWELIHYFEGIMENPKRAIAQIVCRKLINL
jgi:SAM-dependent methyltransferase